jgi:hypothetical protein
MPTITAIADPARSSAMTVSPTSVRSAISSRQRAMSNAGTSPGFYVPASFPSASRHDERAVLDGPLAGLTRDATAGIQPGRRVRRAGNGISMRMPLPAAVRKPYCTFDLPSTSLGVSVTMPVLPLTVRLPATVFSVTLTPPELLCTFSDAWKAF